MTSKLQERETVGHRSISARPGIDDGDVARIKHIFQERATNSGRVANSVLKFLPSTMQRVSHEKPGMFPYNIYFLQRVLREDYPRWFSYAQYTPRELRKNSGYLESVPLNDGSDIYRNGATNEHNTGLWSHECSHTFVEVPHISQKVLIWLAIPIEKIVSPYFFIKRAVTCEGYERIL